MASLKAFSGVLASSLAIRSEGAIYERQRSLIKAGALPSPAGRGRGHGLEATAETVAVMLIAILTTDSLSETDSRILTVADLPFSGGYFNHRTTKRCVVTDAKTFKHALVEILASPNIASLVCQVTLRRRDFDATISFYKPKTKQHHGITKFGNDEREFPELEISATLSGDALRKISSALQGYEK